MANLLQFKQVALYVHWPFCESKCPYCDFNSHVREAIDTDEFLKCYLKELSLYLEYLSDKKIKSIFFGGGTPSLAPPRLFEAIIHSLSRYLHDKIEITIEANPSSSDISKFRAFKNAGINRISIGVQSFDDKALKFLGRKHSSNSARKAIDDAAKIFDNYSFDLIYALPWHTVHDWERELELALEYSKYHLSLYQLTIEKGTKFFTDYVANKFTIPGDELAADLYLSTNALTKKAGLQLYEISNYAKSGYECIHNMVYWEYGDYIGIGPGAHGRITIDNKKIATMNFHTPEKWVKTMQKQGESYQTYEEIIYQDQSNERLMMGLRTVKGLLLNDLAADNIFMLKVAYLAEKGILLREGNVIRVTDQGRLVLNAILKYLIS